MFNDVPLLEPYAIESNVRYVAALGRAKLNAAYVGGEITDCELQRATREWDVWEMRQLAMIAASGEAAGER